MFKRLFLPLLACLALPAQAAFNVFATVPEWGALVQAIGGDNVSVFVATNGLQDPHHVDAKPSLIARARNADLVVATGAELEVGWLPLVLREAGNARVQPGLPGYFEATRYVRMLEVPSRLDRADGDVHAAGNPHVQTDPRNLLRVGEALAQRLAELDAGHAAAYQAGYQAFAAQWRAAAQSPKMVLRAAYNAPRAADWYAERAKVPEVVLPFTVGGSERAKDLYGLFDDTIDRLTKALR